MLSGWGGGAVCYLGEVGALYVIRVGWGSSML